MPYKPENGEVFFCAQCRRQYPAGDNNRCPVHKDKLLVSWYTMREDSAAATKRWESINGKVRRPFDDADDAEENNPKRR
jgi:hypothetical protein